MNQFDFNNILAKVMIKTVKSGNRHGCIMWTGAYSDSGYGRVRNPFSKLNNQPTMYRSHRLIIYCIIYTSTMICVYQSLILLDMS